ncbi:MAG TPA: M90 family metallopeptidase [Rhodocyclaceae bacterium]
MLEFVTRLLRRLAPAPRLPTEAEWQAAEAKLPMLQRLNQPERQRLRELGGEFLRQKQWSAARGLHLDAAMQMHITLQACLPILNLGLAWYDDWVGIVVYPGEFLAPRQMMDEAGLVHEYDDVLLGESWDHGPVLLSWFPPGEEPAGVNVVLHELAHKLDMRHGEADGIPPLHAGMSRPAWIRALQAAFVDFQHKADRGEAPFDPYGAEHPAEFFAVSSEVFFLQPECLQRAYPAYYAQLVGFYRQDPLQCNN